MNSTPDYVVRLPARLVLAIILLALSVSPATCLPDVQVTAPSLPGDFLDQYVNPTAWCWAGAFTRDFCCDLIHGPFGNPDCWGGDFTYAVCCKGDESAMSVQSDNGTQNASEWDFDPVRAEQTLGPQLDKALRQGKVSLQTLEHSLRQAATSADNRIMVEPTARAFLALAHHRQGRTAEAIAEMRKSQQTHKFHISSNGAWVGPNAAGYHFHDKSFSDALLSFFRGRKVQRVADFGCGLGLYVRDLREAGIRAGGFDGNPVTREISEGRCGHEDLSKELDFGTRWGWTMSLEVAEHIPPEFESVFLDNLDRHTCEGIVISWGNQRGEGHVNLRSSAYVQEIFQQRGYETLKWSTEALRDSAHLPWLRNTVVVLKRLTPLTHMDGCAKS